LNKVKTEWVATLLFNDLGLKPSFKLRSSGKTVTYDYDKRPCVVGVLVQLA